MRATSSERADVVRSLAMSFLDFACYSEFVSPTIAALLRAPALGRLRDHVIAKRADAGDFDFNGIAGAHPQWRGALQANAAWCAVTMTSPGARGQIVEM